jgi:hypothetical protein
MCWQLAVYGEYGKMSDELFVEKKSIKVLLEGETKTSRATELCGTWIWLESKHVRPSPQPSAISTRLGLLRTGSLHNLQQLINSFKAVSNIISSLHTLNYINNKRSSLASRLQ